MDTARVAAMIGCFDRGLGVRATARELKAGRTTVARWHRRWKATRGGAILVVGLHRPALLQLMPAAAARGIPVETLLGRLAEAVAEYGLADDLLGEA